MERFEERCRVSETKLVVVDGWSTGVATMMRISKFVLTTPNLMALAMAYRFVQTEISFGNASKMLCCGQDDFDRYCYWDAPPVFAWGGLGGQRFPNKISSVVEDGSPKCHRL